MAAGSFDVLLLHLLLIWWTRSHPLVANHNDDGRRRLEQWRSNRLGFAINSPICRKRKAETLRSKRFGNRSLIAGVAAQFRLLCACLTSVLRGRRYDMAILLRFRQRPHVNAVFLQPARYGVRITPFVLGFSINLRYLNSAELFFDILLVKPVFVLVERLVT